MSDSSLRLRVEGMLESQGWVRALARRLASGDSSADDLEQSTWLAALQSSPAHGVPMRSWLATIARNFARQQRRASSRRSEHEARAARGEAQTDSSDVVERAEVARGLAGAVMRLDEPYRTAILLRFFDELSPREIARRTGQPVATVRSHIARGLERLRASLDREHGGRRSTWILALAPLCAPAGQPVPPVPALTAALLVKTKLVALAVLVSLVVVGIWWSRRAPHAELAPVANAATTPLVEPRAVAETTEEIASDAARAMVEPAPESAAITAKSAPVAAAAAAVRGRVLDAHGAPAAGIRVVALGENARELASTSDVRGEFELVDAPARGTISNGSPALSTVMRAHFERSSAAQPPTVVVAPRLDFAGRIVDASGIALAGATVELALPDDFRSRFQVVLDRSETLSWRAESEADGAYALDDVPQVEGALLRVALTGYEPRELPLPAASDYALDLVLQTPPASDGWVRGRVVDASGSPLEDAYVAFGVDTVVTPADGSFAFELDDPESFSARFGMPANALVALKRGLMPARFDAPREGERAVWPSFVTLRLAGEPLAIAGVVKGHDGRAMPGVRVYVSDATLFGAVEGGGPAMLEHLLAGDATRMWNWVDTDAAGAFVVEGLLEREYVVRAHDPNTLLRVDSPPLRAGSRGVEIVLPTDELHLRVAGRVLSFGGAPIAGAEVYPMCDAFQARANGAVIGTSHDARDGVVTDAEGRFELLNVPKSLVYLRVEGEDILPLEYGRYVEGDARFADAVRELPRDAIEKLELRVERRCHVQVELRDAESADELAVLDEKGRELVLSLFVGTGRNERLRHAISGGRSAVLGVPDTGRTLVLFRAGAEVGRVRIELDPSELTVVRP